MTKPAGKHHARKSSAVKMCIRDSTVAVQCLEDVTPELGLKYLDNFGFTTLAHGETDENGNVYTDANLSTALGGITSGVTNVEDVYKSQEDNRPLRLTIPLSYPPPGFWRLKIKSAHSLFS